jgi:hypothetical protein
MVKQIRNIRIDCSEMIKPEIYEIFCQNFQSEFDMINEFFNITYDVLNIHLVTKERLNSVVKEKSLEYREIDIPTWLVGFSTGEEVFVTVPNENTLNELYKVALHEITHLISYKLDTTLKRLKILDEGIAVYLSNQYEGKTLTPWVNSYLKGSLPKVSDFCTYSSIEFANKKGYHYAYFIIEFLIITYGKATFLEWLQNPDRFTNNIKEIDELFKAYIIRKIEANIHNSL